MFKIYAKDSYCLPERAFATDAGIDLRAAESVVLKHGETTIVGCGIHIELPPCHVGLIFPRSGLAVKKGVSLANSVGVIDADYRGEIKCGLIFKSTGCGALHRINQYDRIAQLVVVKIPVPDFEVVEGLDELTATDRGEGGFGHTGVK